MDSLLKAVNVRHQFQNAKLVTVVITSIIIDAYLATRMGRRTTMATKTITVGANLATMHRKAKPSKTTVVTAKKTYVSAKRVERKVASLPNLRIVINTEPTIVLAASLTKVTCFRLLKQNNS